MKRLFIFKKESSGAELVLPVTPSGYELERTRSVEAIDMQEAGTINLPGLPGLLNKPLECMFPAQEYPFCNPGTVTDPYYYVNAFRGFVDNGDVLRFIVSDTGINEPVLVAGIEYGERDGTGDIYATIRLRGYRDVTAPETQRTAPEQNLPRSSPPAAETVQQTYVVVAGDSLWSICNRFYGDGSLAYRLAAYNGIENAALIYPGQVLKLPALGEVSATKPVQSSGGSTKKTSPAPADTPEPSPGGSGDSGGQETRYYSLTVSFSGSGMGYGHVLIEEKNASGGTVRMFAMDWTTAKVYAAPEGHTLKVQWWGDKGAECTKALFDGSIMGSIMSRSFVVGKKSHTLRLEFAKAGGGG